MANVSRINGFKPVKHKTGAPFNGQCTLYVFMSGYATAAYIGDVVKIVAGADTVNGVRSVNLASAGDAACGVIVGFLPDPTNLNVAGTGKAASTTRYVWVADATDLVFEAEVSNGTPLYSSVGLNANHAIGSPSATLATSGAYLDFATFANTATFTFKLVGFADRPDNEIGASAKMLCTINNHQLGASTGTVGLP